ncbi:MAG: MBL fold metallo-hydrolase [Casimicrobiaceae bacterium]
MRRAATLLLLRDTASGPEVLLQQRAADAVFMAGAFVFPGGAVEPSDNAPASVARVTGLTDAVASQRLGLPSGGLAYWIAALRECFEEAGILLAHDDAGVAIPPSCVGAMVADRSALNRGELAFARVLERHGQYLPGGEVTYFDHWITPPTASRRFDTRFFVARAPTGQAGSHDNAEAIHAAWLRPADALDRMHRQAMPMGAATRAVLEEFQRFASVQEALEYARAKTTIESNRVVVAQGADGQQLIRRHDAAYAETHWCDPDETMQTTYDLLPGIPKSLDHLVTRIIAPNPGMMTGPGTNTYLVGTDDLVVIDPGPAIDAHVAAILACASGRIRWIACTHTHLDHSPAALALQRATGARCIGLPPPGSERQDQSFVPDWPVEHDALLRIAGVELRALLTPGHASNHVCFLLEDTGMLFTGDHVMQGSTVVINPPDGDMAAYLESLDALLRRDIAVIAPGHGYLIGTPHREIRRVIEHRRRREAKVVDALAGHPGASLFELVPVVYADTPERLHGAASRSLLAHLEQLVGEGRAVASQGRYALRNEP